MQFELFEKQPSANNFQIEREKPYDYPLVIYIKKALFERFPQPARRSCLAS